MTKHLMTGYQMSTIIPFGTGLVENTQTLGLSHDYKDSSNVISKWLKHSFLLYFLCPSCVEDRFCEDVMSATPEDHRCSKYADCLFENYLKSHQTIKEQIMGQNHSTGNSTRPSNNSRLS